MKKSTQKVAAPDIATEASTTKAVTAEPKSAPSLRILKIARCPTVSGKSPFSLRRKSSRSSTAASPSSGRSAESLTAAQS